MSKGTCLSLLTSPTLDDDDFDDDDTSPTLDDDDFDDDDTSLT